MEQYQRKIEGSKIPHTRKSGSRFSKDANNTSAPKPSDIQKLIKKVIKKEGE